ncbi:NACHT, LRR and PYD domains-containing protein 3-like [Mobula hypostoma]|uniref:NACHT, LRR and PYD domains-containing protein 3-like n=1 Tax=Mobula hypostoma TaxID=723540 RepID=UPI002FC2D8F7
MATNANSRADVLALTEDRDPDPKSALSELLMQWDDYQLFQLGKFYWERLTEAIEGGVGKFSLMLREEGHLSADEHEIIYRLAERGNWMDSSKLFLGLVMGKGSPTWIVMWKSFVKVRGELPKLDRILEEIQEFGLGVHEYMNVARGFSESPIELTDVRQRHRETLRARTETLRVSTMQTGAKVQVFRLLDRYAEVTVISRAGRRGVGEHELLAGGPDGGELGEMGLQTELEKIRMDQLFRSSFPQSTSRPRSSAAVAGVPGIGKTTMVQKIVYDWATGKIYQQFQFVFSFKFRDLNNLNCRVNLRELILDQYPYFGNTLGEVWKDPEKLLFIFDGLDEFKDRIDFANSRRDTEPQHTCTDPEFRCKVSDVVYSLIQHKLLPGCSVLVTTRPAALPLLEKADISVWAEILGFVGEERKEYFSRHFEDQAVASAVFEHVQENEILYTMSYNPACCLILALALGPFTLTVRDPRRVPQTITQLYSCYLYSVLKNHGQELKSPCDLLLRIGQMAFTGVSESNIIFTDGDLIKWNLQPSQLLSGFPTELLEREESAQSVVYTFPHLTVQEFIAALAQFLAPDPGDLNLLAEARGKEDGRFEMFLRFAAGLSAAGSTRVLEEFLGPLPRRTAGQVADWVREEVGRQIRNMWGEASQKRLLNALHYLFESQDRGLAQATLGSMDVLSFRGLRLTPIDCAVLSHAIGLCDRVKRLDLKSCRIESGRLQQLGPGLHKCQELRLGFNHLGDSAGKVVSAALRVPGCQIQRLWLNHSGLQDPDVNHLASALRTNRSLMELDVRGNALGDSGVKLLSAALRDPNCKLQILGLWNVGLTDSGTEDLTSALRTNRSLTELDLGSNDLGDSGVKLVSAALRDPESKLQKLDLTRVELTDSGAEDLAFALSTNRSLRELDLSKNTLGDSGVKFLSEALRDPECKLQSLGLICNNLTAACTADLASIVSANPSLVELKLGINELGDVGVKLLTATLKKRDCKLQRLQLDENGLTGSCVKDLASALGAGSSLTGLDLSYNQLGDLGVKQLSKALKSPDCKLEKLRLRAVGLMAPYVRYLASAVKANHSLVELDLGRNELRDSGVKLLSAALRKAGCRLQKLGLYAAELTDSCTDDLVTTLGINRSVTQLNLGSNSFTDLSVPALCLLVQSRENLERIKLWENQFSAEGQKQLQSLQGTRPRLRVDIQRSYDP